MESGRKLAARRNYLLLGTSAETAKPRSGDVVVVQAETTPGSSRAARQHRSSLSSVHHSNYENDVEELAGVRANQARQHCACEQALCGSYTRTVTTCKVRLI